MVTVSSIYTAPPEFHGRLAEEFGGRLRLRWSLQRSAWIIEQKIGAAALPPLRIDTGRDDQIQARDGYAPVLTIQPGDRMACEFCNLSVKVPVREIAEVPCPWCLAKGRDARFVCTYWPLDETLIDYLKSIDPARRGGREMRRRLLGASTANEQLIEQRDRAATAEREAVGRYYFPQMFQIPSVGWTAAKD